MDGAPATATASSAAPVLTTERLTLRGHRADDFTDVAAMWGDPAVTRHIGGKPLSREEAWTKFLRNVGHWVLAGYGFWLVHETASGRFVGEVGCAELRRDLTPPRGGIPEAGWVLAPWAHGRGFATEAVRAALAWTAGRVGHGRSFCLIDPGNAGSLRVADKCGFRQIAQTSYKGGPVLVLERRA
jgi:RimJ/RimL family protein N-acetyltransferase